MLKTMQKHTHAFLFFVWGLFLMLVWPSLIPTSSAATALIPQLGADFISTDLASKTTDIYILDAAKETYRINLGVDEISLNARTMILSYGLNGVLQQKSYTVLSPGSLNRNVSFSIGALWDIQLKDWAYFYAKFYGANKIELSQTRWFNAFVGSLAKVRFDALAKARLTAVTRTSTTAVAKSPDPLYCDKNPKPIDCIDMPASATAKTTVTTTTIPALDGSDKWSLLSTHASAPFVGFDFNFRVLSDELLRDNINIADIAKVTKVEEQITIFAKFFNTALSVISDNIWGLLKYMDAYRIGLNYNNAEMNLIKETLKAKLTATERVNFDTSLQFISDTYAKLSKDDTLTATHKAAGTTTCTDSDGGIIPNVQWTTTAWIMSRTDTCAVVGTSAPQIVNQCTAGDPNCFLREFSCSNNAVIHTDFQATRGCSKWAATIAPEKLKAPWVLIPNGQWGLIMSVPCEGVGNECGNYGYCSNENIGGDNLSHLSLCRERGTNMIY